MDLAVNILNTLKQLEYCRFCGEENHQTEVCKLSKPLWCVKCELLNILCTNLNCICVPTDVLLEHPFTMPLTLGDKLIQEVPTNTQGFSDHGVGVLINGDFNIDLQIKMHSKYVQLRTVIEK